MATFTNPIDGYSMIIARPRSSGRPDAGVSLSCTCVGVSGHRMEVHRALRSSFRALFATSRSNDRRPRGAGVPGSRHAAPV